VYRYTGLKPGEIPALTGNRYSRNVLKKTFLKQGFVMKRITTAVSIIILMTIGCSTVPVDMTGSSLLLSTRSNIINPGTTLQMDPAEASAGTSTLALVLTNSGNHPLSIDTILLRGSTDVFSLDKAPATYPVALAGGRSIVLGISFTPDTAGSFSTTVSINRTGLADGSLEAVIRGTGTADPVVEKPWPKVYLPVVPVGTTISFMTTTPGATCYTGTAAGSWAEEPVSWDQTGDIMLNANGVFTLFSKATGSGMHESAVNRLVIEVAGVFPGQADSADTDAISMNSKTIINWADSTVDIQEGLDVTPLYMDSGQALGMAQGTAVNCYSLGNNGTITLTFPTLIVDGPGMDFSVFENGFSDTFLELAFVEVSSNGSDFARFDSASLTAAPVGSFGSINPEDIYGFAGRYRQGFGTPFDLRNLEHTDEVRNGLVDLHSISHVRIVDIAGDEDLPLYTQDYDSFNRPVYDPFKTMGSAGFDLDAIGVMQCM
jgi:hypothetical protein